MKFSRRNLPETLSPHYFTPLFSSPVPAPSATQSVLTDSGTLTDSSIGAIDFLSNIL